MAQIIEERILQQMSDEQLLSLIKERGVFLHLYNGAMKEGRVVGIGCSENGTSIVRFDTDLCTYRPTIKRIEIIDRWNNS